MLRPAIEPLETTLWFRELEKLYERRANVDGEAPDALFRKAFYLAQLAPVALRASLPVLIDEDALEAFLECGAYLQAAVTLIADPTGVKLERQPASELFTATISIAGLGSGQDTDKEPSKALLGAWCKATLSVRNSGTLVSDLFPGRPVERGEPNRWLTKH